ncbi:MAG: hypothetical protein M1818_008531 [Claussenomyces sp. TS43310]|nr:MAG: hypothetical protein M1818_008531 [Claussenomyces sp. TS43310]
MRATLDDAQEMKEGPTPQVTAAGDPASGMWNVQRRTLSPRAQQETDRPGVSQDLDAPSQGIVVVAVEPPCTPDGWATVPYMRYCKVEGPTIPEANGRDLWARKADHRNSS